MASSQVTPNRTRRRKLVFSASLILTLIAVGFLGCAFILYWDDIGVSVHGTVNVANAFGSPYAVELATTADQQPFFSDSFTPVTPLTSPNSSAYFSLKVISGHDYNVFVTVSAPGKGAPDGCTGGMRFLPGCTVCQSSRIHIPWGVTDYSYNISVTCSI